MNNFIVISYYTKDTGYEEEAKNLQASLEDFKIPYDIVGIDNLGDWDKNTRYKAEFIYGMLQKYERVVFLDADAEVKKYPEIFDELDCDIAVHIREGRELLSGTIFAQKTEKTLTLLKFWIAKNRSTAFSISEQRNLAHLLRGNEVPGLKWVELPASYCQIFDSMAHNGEPVIQHNQASRRLKSAVLLK